ncbi:MAG: HAD family hydrolase [Eubacteriales bacterium]|nr:HAD family hydrolase [Eubacteriales bacterium]
MAIKAVFLDFYGTLAREDDGLIKNLCRKVCETSALNIQPADAARYWWECTNSFCRRYSGADFKSQLEIEKLVLEAVNARYESALPVEGTLNDILQSWQQPETWSDVRPFLAQLPLKVCIVANAEHATLEKALRHLRLDVPDILCSEDAHCYKPDVAIFQRALSVMDVKPKEALFVGDSLHYDIAPAKAVGMFTAWLNRAGRPLGGECTPDTTLASLMQLKSMMR